MGFYVSIQSQEGLLFYFSEKIQSLYSFQIELQVSGTQISNLLYLYINVELYKLVTSNKKKGGDNILCFAGIVWNYFTLECFGRVC